jgi:hypothetical protein
LTSAATNKKHDIAGYGAAVANVLAGGTQLASAFVSGNQGISVVAASSAAWGVNALTNLGKTAQDAYKGEGGNLANAVKGAGGLFNLGGAAAAGVSAFLTKVGNPAARPVAITSGALWAVGAGLDGTAAWLKGRHSAENPPLDLEANRSAGPVASQAKTAPGDPRSPETKRPGPTPGAFGSANL